MHHNENLSIPALQTKTRSLMTKIADKKDQVEELNFEIDLMRHAYNDAYATLIEKQKDPAWKAQFVGKERTL